MLAPSIAYGASKGLAFSPLLRYITITHALIMNRRGICAAVHSLV